MYYFYKIFFLLLFFKLSLSKQYFDLCNSPIYCQGELLKTVQLSAIFSDSKTFVDLSQKNDEQVTLANFEKMMEETNRMPSKQDVRNFVLNNFLQQDELINVTLPDWTSRPKILNRVGDRYYKKWIKDLNEIWKMLARRMTLDVRDNPSRHSLLYVNNTFIIPGGRFKEFYYWDSYWIVEGLLLCDMVETTRGILENFLSVVNTYGFVPNGGRVYYLMRSQPPLLIPMVDLYYEATNDWNFVRKHLSTLEKEFNFWQRYKSITINKDGKDHKMAYYNIESPSPRPESYREDYTLAANLIDESRRDEFFNNIKAGAESGWDFSARWFIDENGDFSQNLQDISTKNIIPVDLNAFLERNARILARYFTRVGNIVKVKDYTARAKAYRDGLEALNWNERDGIWYDYDYKHKKQRKLFYPTNLTPLYTMSYNWELGPIYGSKALNYLNRIRITDYIGGTPSSLDNTTQQWDFPNAWPPLQSIIVQGLRLTNYAPAMELANKLADTWLKSNYFAFSQTMKMFEKYDATQFGRYGGGGEYVVQEGFGWTNGVVFEFLNTYPWSMLQNNNSIILNNKKFREKIRRVNSEKLHPRINYGSRLTLQSIWDHYHR